jgi:hypothetical protein
MRCPWEEEEVVGEEGACPRRKCNLELLSSIGLTK